MSTLALDRQMLVQMEATAATLRYMQVVLWEVTRQTLEDPFMFRAVLQTQVLVGASATVPVWELRLLPATFKWSPLMQGMQVYLARWCFQQVPRARVTQVS